MSAADDVIGKAMAVLEGEPPAEQIAGALDWAEHELLALAEANEGRLRRESIGRR